MSESELRQLLIKQDVEGILNVVEADLPGQPGNATRRNNLSGCRIFLRWAFDTRQSVLSPTQTLGSEYLAFLQHKHPETPASVINRLAHARNFYTALQTQGAAAVADPFAQLNAPSNDPALHKQAYTEAEIQRMLVHGDAREQALVLLGAHAGLTGPEVAGLNWRDMQFEQGVLSVRGREVPTGSALHAALQVHAHQQGVTQLFGGEGRVFPVSGKRSSGARRSLPGVLGQQRTVPGLAVTAKPCRAADAQLDPKRGGGGPLSGPEHPQGRQVHSAGH